MFPTRIAESGSFESVSAHAFSIGTDDTVKRSPCFTLYLVERGSGVVHVDYAEHAFAAPVLISLNPYQKVRFQPRTIASGWVLFFHANFFCIETHHHAVGCNGVLFNEVYEAPIVALSAAELEEFRRLMQDVAEELRCQAVAHLEVLVSSLKILLIKATRLKLAQQGSAQLPATGRPEVLRRLRELIETHYQSLHSPSEYARLLGVSTKSLAQLVKTHHHKTLTELIRDRIVKHAKWQLLHTPKAVKEIAYEVGFDDEFYFSRLFKRACGSSPLTFREYETTLRGGAQSSTR